MTNPPRSAVWESSVHLLNLSDTGMYVTVLRKVRRKFPTDSSEEQNWINCKDFFF